MIAFMQTDRQAAVFRGTRAPEGVAERWGGVAVICPRLSQNRRRKKGANGKRLKVFSPIFSCLLFQPKPREKRGGSEKKSGEKQIRLAIQSKYLFLYFNP